MNESDIPDLPAETFFVYGLDSQPMHVHEADEDGNPMGITAAAELTCMVRSSGDATPREVTLVMSADLAGYLAWDLVATLKALMACNHEEAKAEVSEKDIQEMTVRTVEEAIRATRGAAEKEGK